MKNSTLENLVGSSVTVNVFGIGRYIGKLLKRAAGAYAVTDARGGFVEFSGKRPFVVFDHNHIQIGTRTVARLAR